MTNWTHRTYKQNQAELQNAEPQWVDDGGRVRDVPIDPSTQGIIIVDYPHHELHSGGAYHVSDVQSVSTTTIKWMITTPDTSKYSHMLFNIECTGEMLVLITEGADRNGSNLLTSVNHNRNSSETAGTVVHRAVSGGTTDGTTTIFTKRSGTTGAGATANSPGEASRANEYMLKRNTKYIVAVTTYDAVYVSLELDWYEHTDKE